MREGRYLDPDTSDVPWVDKRKGLAELAWVAAAGQSSNYVADTEVSPHKVTFANGRTVHVDSEGCLQVGRGPYPGESS